MSGKQAKKSSAGARRRKPPRGKPSSSAAPAVESRMVFTCGPYKSYYGRAEWDADDGDFYGKVIGTRDLITFVGATHTDLEREFVHSVDDYLALCEKHGLPAEKPFSGKFLARIKPETHRALTTIAEQSSVSFNQLIADILDRQASLPPAHRS